MWSQLLLNLPEKSNSPRFPKFCKNSTAVKNQLIMVLKELKKENKRCQKEAFYYRNETKNTSCNIQKLFRMTLGGEEVQCLSAYQLGENIKKSQKCVSALSSIVMSYWPESIEECPKQGHKFLKLWTSKMCTRLVLNSPRSNSPRLSKLCKKSVLEKNQLMAVLKELKKENKRCQRQVLCYRNEAENTSHDLEKMLKIMEKDSEGV